MQQADLVVINIGQLLTMEGDGLGIENNTSLAITDGKIVAVGPEALSYQAKHTIDAKGKLVTPGLIDCHTHLVFAGSREQEMAARFAGAGYLEILAQGGGILSTVKSVTESSADQLLTASKQWLDLSYAHGVTTIEIKSGYGLDYVSELKMLQVINQLKQEAKQEIIATFLAHAFPADYKNKQEEYVELIKTKFLPEFKKLAEHFDIFVEEGVFSSKQADQLLAAAASQGYKLKMHVNQINNVGGIALATKHKVLSVDHLDNITEEELKQLASTGAVAVLLPGASYFLNCNTIPPINLLKKYNIKIAIASNFNPGSCPCPNLPLMMSLAIHRFGLSPEEAWQAVTINAARALGREKEIGSVEVGKQANLVLWNAENYLQPIYYFGVNLVDRVIKNGEF